MFRNRSLAFKFILFFSGSCSIIFLSIIGLNFHLSRRIILSDIRQNAENIALRAVNKINGALSEIEEIPPEPRPCHRIRQPEQTGNRRSSAAGGGQ